MSFKACPKREKKTKGLNPKKIQSVRKTAELSVVQPREITIRILVRIAQIKWISKSDGRRENSEEL